MIVLLACLLGVSMIPLTTFALFEIRGYFYIRELMAMVTVWNVVMLACCAIAR